MKDHVFKFAEALRKEGKYVEILDDEYLKPVYDDGYQFIVDGKKWTVSSAWDDMVRNTKWNKYKGADGRIKNEYLPQTPMFKVNKLWIEKAQKDGATILDIGYPNNFNGSKSAFYEMEIQSVKWD